MTKNEQPWIPMVIALRAYTRPVPGDDAKLRPAKGKRKARKTLRKPTDFTLVFDTETTADHIQKLRIGSYQVREGLEVCESGIFCEPCNLGASDLLLLKSYTAERGLALRTREEFIREVLYRYGYYERGLILGFNLPFDLSRIAIGSGTSHARDMRDGFSLTLLPEKRFPHLIVKHLNSRTAFMRFAAPPGPIDGRGMRKKGFKTQAPTGYFQDLKTLATSLLGLRSISLASLTELLGIEHAKTETDEHGGPLTCKYLDYAMNDTQATWECYVRLKAIYEKHGLTETPPHRIYSEAALGKAYFRQMGIQSWSKVQEGFPPEITGAIMAAYYGGRSEVRVRRQMTRVFACDFRSMYPTVCTLMKLWTFMIATGINHEDYTLEARMLLNRVGLADLQRQNIWPFLTTLVQVEAHDDVFPVRAAYNGTSRTIGLNHLRSNEPLSYTLADCIASKLLTGKAPKIVRATRFTPKDPQPGLKPIDIAGNPEFRIDPYKNDLFKHVIELRGDVQSQEKQAKAEGRTEDAERLKAFQEMLKLLANSTSYGIFAEINVQSYDRPRDVTCYGLGNGYVVGTKSVEEPGTSFHPLLATLITGAARLMLAIAETLALRAGIGWAFCDTDSLALACPEGMSDGDFIARATGITQWFDPLNPYGDRKPLFKIEDENFALKGGNVQKDEYEQLYVFAVSSKRYVLFNIGCDGKPIIRKASAHGLGHLLPPYKDNEAPVLIPAPSIPLKEIGIERWQYDVWYQIIMAELEGHPDQVNLTPLPHLDRAAASRYTAATPTLLHWFDKLNASKSYAERIKPFNFTLAFQVSRPKLYRYIAQGKLDLNLFDGDEPSPAAPYDKNSERAAKHCFDRNTGAPVPRKILATYREVIANYHLHSESKFDNGQATDKGLTDRRHVHAIGIEHIGKEANRWEEVLFLGDVANSPVVYGSDSGNYERMIGIICEAAVAHTQVALADAAGITRQELAAIISCASRARPQTMRALMRAIAELWVKDRDTG